MPTVSSMCSSKIAKAMTPESPRRRRRCERARVLGGGGPQDEARYKRWSQVHATVRDLLEHGVELIIPAPSIAELYAGGEDGVRVAVALEKQGKHPRIEAFDDEAARVAGQIMRIRLSARAKTSEQPALAVVKFDAMIVGTAIAAGADCIVTTDGDIQKYIDVLDERHRIQVIDATAPTGQLTFIG